MSIGRGQHRHDPISHLMSTEVHACGPEDSLETAARIMWEHDCGAVPVVDSGRHVLAMITDRDVCMAAYTQGRPLSAIPVSVAMSRSVHDCKPYECAGDVERRFWMYQVRRMPVTDDARRLVGVISLGDLARNVDEGADVSDSLSPASLAITLAGISEPRRVA